MIITGRDGRSWAIRDDAVCVACGATADTHLEIIWLPAAHNTSIRLPQVHGCVGCYADEDLMITSHMHGSQVAALRRGNAESV